MSKAEAKAEDGFKILKVECVKDSKSFLDDLELILKKYGDIYIKLYNIFEDKYSSRGKLSTLISEINKLVTKNKDKVIIVIEEKDSYINYKISSYYIRKYCARGSKYNKKTDKYDGMKEIYTMILR